jgi:hypothetical protein
LILVFAKGAEAKEGLKRLEDLIPEHGEFCIKRSGLEPTFVLVRLFPAKITPLLRTSRIAPHYFE